METSEETELCFPQLLNTSCVKPRRPHLQTMLTYILLFSVFLLTASLNLLVIISVSHFKIIMITMLLVFLSRQLHSPTNLLLLSLAVSDFFVSFLFLFQVIFIDGCWFLSDFMCSLYQYLDYIITTVSVETTVLISIDRYVAICDPLHYSTKVTQHGVKMCVCLFWICSVTQARAIRSHVTAATKRAVKVTASKSELKAARTLGVVIVVFLMCLCPYYCVSPSNQHNLMNAYSNAFVICLYYFNARLNPIIYAFFYDWFRKSIKLIVTLKILQPDSCEANLL